MKKLIGLVILIAASYSPAAHAGFGVTAGTGGYADGTSWVPSLDWRANGILVQMHLLDQLAPLATGGDFYPNIGADVTVVAVKKKIAAEIEGVVMPGGGIRVTGGGSLGWNVMGEARFGMEMKQGMGFGVYVVPALGVTNLASGDVGVNYGGAVQISVWMVK